MTDATQPAATRQRSAEGQELQAGSAVGHPSAAGTVGGGAELQRLQGALQQRVQAGADLGLRRGVDRRAGQRQKRQVGGGGSAGAGAPGPWAPSPAQRAPAWQTGSTPDSSGGSSWQIWPLGSVRMIWKRRRVTGEAGWVNARSNLRGVLDDQAHGLADLGRVGEEHACDVVALR